MTPVFEKKVYVYIDAANIIMSSEGSGENIDFKKLYKYINDKFRAEKIFYFTGNLKKITEEIESLSRIGYDIVQKGVYLEQNKIKANCDVEISHYITKHIENSLASEIILLSGDGDFAMLFDYAKEKRVTSKLMPYNKKSTSKILRRKDFVKIIFIDQLKNKALKEKTPAST